ncbi:MAG: hypothetical protein ACLUQ6_04100 [Alistipes onderdonkii]
MLEIVGRGEQQGLSHIPDGESRCLHRGVASCAVICPDSVITVYRQKFE